MKSTGIKVRVPSTTANLGPGFDTLGLALDVWNDLIVESSDTQVIEVLGEDAPHLPKDDTNLVITGMKAAFYIGGLASVWDSTAFPSLSEKRKSVLCRKALESDWGIKDTFVPKRRLPGLFIGKWYESAFWLAILNDFQKIVQDEDSEIQENSLIFHRVNLPPYRYTYASRIPCGRGLGSSAAALIAGLIAGFSRLNFEVPYGPEPPSDAENLSCPLFNIVSILEGHGDNASAALYGGLQIVLRVHYPLDSIEGRESAEQRYDMPKTYSVAKAVPPSPVWACVGVGLSDLALRVLRCVVFVPDVRTDTGMSRANLPATVDREDAVFNGARIALLINSLQARTLTLLRHGMEDRLHQPLRSQTSVPHLYPTVRAALRAGALSACLSGSGSSVVAFVAASEGSLQETERDKTHEWVQDTGDCALVTAVGEAMFAAAAAVGIGGRILFTAPTTEKAHLEAQGVEGDGLCQRSGLKEAPFSKPLTAPTDSTELCTERTMISEPVTVTSEETSRSRMHQRL